MQPLSVSYSTEYAEISGKTSEDFMAKLKLEKLEGEGGHEEEEEEADDDEEDEEEEEDFSFVCANPDGSPVSADDIFQDGRVRPMYPIFNQDLLFAGRDYGGYEVGDHASSTTLRPPLRKLFLQECDIPLSSASVSGESQTLPEATYCAWSGKTAVDASPEVCKKSNSTGFSKLWRFRDLAMRSNSDGKDAFLFFNPLGMASTKHSNSEKGEKTEETKVKSKANTGEAAEGKAKRKKKKGQTASSGQEKVYATYRAPKEGDKRKSFLPYRVGFFTSVNGLSRNVHPF